MESLIEPNPTLPNLNFLQTQILGQITELATQRGHLAQYSTDINQLITRYNAEKSYLEHAAHWYGELSWWLKIWVSVMVASFGILLTIPWIISIALSLTLSILFIDHHHITKKRDQLICVDLQAQNASVQTALTLLEDTKTELERTLQTLCDMSLKMGEENIRLRNNVAEVTQQANQLRAQTQALQMTIDDLQEKNKQLVLDLAAGQIELDKYATMVRNGSLVFADNVHNIQEATKGLQSSNATLREVASRLDVITSPQRPIGGAFIKPTASPDDIAALKGAQSILDVDQHDLEAELARIQEQKTGLTPTKSNNKK